MTKSSDLTGMFKRKATEYEKENIYTSQWEVKMQVSYSRFAGWSRNQRLYWLCVACSFSSRGWWTWHWASLCGSEVKDLLLKAINSETDLWGERGRIFISPCITFDWIKCEICVTHHLALYTFSIIQHEFLNLEQPHTQTHPWISIFVRPSMDIMSYDVPYP